MPSRARRAVTAAVGLLLLARCTPDASERTAQAADPIIGGVNDDERLNVLGVVRSGRGGTSICTGSLILPNLVLTARHCVSPVSSETVTCRPYTNPSTGAVTPATTASTAYDAARFAVTAGSNIWNAAAFTAVAEVRVPPGTEDNVVLCGNDVALLVLADPIDDIPLLEPRLDARPVDAEGFTAVGYGATDGMGSGSGRRRSRDGLSVASVGEVMGIGMLLQTETEWRGDTGTCRGDSGGPALDGLGQVMGVLSRGPRTCDTPVYQRVDSWSAWIRAEATRAREQGNATGPAPRWLAPPAPRTGQFGDACRGDAECVEGLACAIVGAERRCTSLDCERCAANWICGEVAGGAGCVPDPAVVVADPPPDAGHDASDASASPLDAGSPGMPAPPVPITTHGGCAVAPARASAARVPALAALGVLAATARARRRRRHPRRRARPTA